MSTNSEIKNLEWNAAGFCEQRQDAPKTQQLMAFVTGTVAKALAKEPPTASEETTSLS